MAEAGFKLKIPSAPTPSTPTTSYLTSDTLGSPRVITDASGNVQSRRDFMPFGEEISAIAGRTSGLGYQTDATRQKFTGYERDDETDLDFAQARMYSNSLGRFNGPDNFLNDTRTIEPASWNLYAYVKNKPTSLIDPEGEKVYVGGLIQSDRDEVLKRMNSTYGCESCVTVDSEGYLQVDTTNIDKLILEAASWLTNAITNNNWYGEVQVSNNDSNVAFGEGRRSRGSVPCESSSTCAGKKRNADLIVLDFGDDQWVSGDEEVKETFLNTVLAHEIAHFYLNPGQITPDPTDTGKTGKVVDAVNEILYARGLPLRGEYSSSRVGDYWLSIQHGFASVDERTSRINRNSDKGIKVRIDDTTKVINWLKKNVGGKGIN